MGDPYSDVTVTGYNVNPPADDGSVSTSNRLNWSKHKEKIGDPLKTAVEAINTSTGAFADKVAGGVVSTATNYTVLSADQGKVIVATDDGIAITTPKAATVGAPFKWSLLNLSAGDITVQGNTGDLVDGASSVTIPSLGGADFDTDGTNWFTRGQNFQTTQVPPQGRLTLTSATPVLAADVTAGTSVYYTPYIGNLLPVYNGTVFQPQQFAELTLALASQHTANNIYDVFAFVDTGVLIIGTGPAWSVATAGSGARGTGAGTTEIEKIKGLWLNKVSMTTRNGSSTYTVAANRGTYLGTIFIDGTNGQLSAHVSVGQNRKFGLWNAFNRSLITLQVTDATANWAYSTATIRQSNGATGNKATVLCGLPDEPMIAEAQQFVTMTTNTAAAGSIGIGWDSTTTIVGRRGTGNNTSSDTSHNLTAKYVKVPMIGISNVSLNETGNGTTTVTFQGTSDNLLMAVSYRG